MYTTQKPPHPPPPSAPSTPSPETSSDEDSVARPSLYRHEPRPRAAPLEEYYGHEPRNLEILAELKSDRLEGVYNLSFILLAFSILFLVVRNVLEHGFLPGRAAISTAALFRDFRVSSLLALLYPLFLLDSFLIVRFLVLRTLDAYTAVLLHGFSLVVFFVASTVLLFKAALNPLFGLFHGLLVVTISLKKHSFVFTNLLLAEETDRRRAARSRKPPTNRHSSNASVSSADSRRSRPQVVYPRNVTLSNYLYYFTAPTLVYETSYPRTKCIRTTYVAWYAFQSLVCLLLQYIILVQFCIPVWQSSVPEERERLWWFCMKLALPTNFFWLLMFWGFFHCTLNVLAELTCFADRQFYQDWWNATTLDQFWRTWNILVHEWCVRHLYVDPVARHNVNRGAAAFGTFFMSAVLHEYVSVVGFRVMRPYMFVGMMIQIPLMRVSTGLAGTRKGNLLMWLMLFCGQSFVMLMYARDFLLMQRAQISL